jgi:fibrillarin-like rRNA methylase
MATDEEIYSLKILDTTVSLTFYRVYCSQENYDNPNYRNWNPFTNPKIDSFFAVSKTFNNSIIDSLDLQNLWSLKTQSALHISDSVGFLDGSTTSIELSSKVKYKLIRHHLANAYYEKTWALVLVNQ